MQLLEACDVGCGLLYRRRPRPGSPHGVAWTLESLPPTTVAAHPPLGCVGTIRRSPRTGDRAGGSRAVHRLAGERAWPVLYRHTMPVEETGPTDPGPVPTGALVAVLQLGNVQDSCAANDCGDRPPAENTRGGDYAYCIDIAHFMAGLPVGVASTARRVDGEPAARQQWHALVTARRDQPGTSE